MSDQYGDADSEKKVTKESILDALKEEGITDLDSLAEYAAKKSGAGGTGPITLGAIIHPGYVIVG